MGINCVINSALSAMQVLGGCSQPLRPPPPTHPLKRDLLRRARVLYVGRDPRGPDT